MGMTSKLVSVFDQLNHFINNVENGSVQLNNKIIGEIKSIYNSTLF